jgi:hypothetical protein
MTAPETLDIDCERCHQTLHVPVRMVTSESSTAGYLLVTLEADHQFLADHAATHD